MSWLNKISIKRFFKRKPKVVKEKVPSMANALGKAGSKKKRGRPKKTAKKKPGSPKKSVKKQ